LNRHLSQLAVVVLSVVHMQLTNIVHQSPAHSFVLLRTLPSDAHHKLVPVRIKFITQVGIRPPTFAVHLNRIKAKDALPASYVRYLTNSLRKEFELDGIPVRFVIKASHNPYTGAGQGTKKHSDSIRHNYLDTLAQEKKDEYQEIAQRRAQQNKDP
jgi:hypothetical protein